MIRQSLTDYEYQGLKSSCSFADGHAYHELAPEYAPIIESLPVIWQKTQHKKVAECEESFKHAWGNLVQSDTLRSHPHFRICPTSSNSIDLVAAFSREKNYKVLLIEPTFDNLYLLLRRRGCEVHPVQESNLLRAISEDSLDLFLSQFDFDVLFLVNPNNPTGTLFAASAVQKIANYCAAHNKLIVFDTTFRFYNKHPFDDYAVVAKSGASFIFIEDTGKTWPTHDMKASLLVFSTDIAPLMNQLYEEIYLCHSRFTLQVFTELFQITHISGIEKCLRAPMQGRKNQLHHTLTHTPLRSLSNNDTTCIPVEWIDISATRFNDVEMESFLRKFGFYCLPGRYFFWSRDPKRWMANRIRFALGRPKNIFDNGMVMLKKIFQLNEGGINAFNL